MQMINMSIDPKLKEIKLRPLSFTAGILLGGLGSFEPYLPFNLIYDVFAGSGLMGLIYTDNRAGGRSVEDSLYNSGICGANYATGVAIGLGAGKAIQKIFY